MLRGANPAAVPTAEPDEDPAGVFKSVCQNTICDQV